MQIRTHCFIASRIAINRKMTDLCFIKYAMLLALKTCKRQGYNLFFCSFGQCRKIDLKILAMRVQLDDAALASAIRAKYKLQSIRS